MIIVHMLIVWGFERFKLMLDNCLICGVTFSWKAVEESLIFIEKMALALLLYLFYHGWSVCIPRGTFRLSFPLA